VPATVASFSELHDHVDANCYAGFCEDAVFDGLIEMYGGRDAGTEALPDGMMRHVNALGDIIDAWLKAGRP
jgi:hypothetical protein